MESPSIQWKQMFDCEAVTDELVNTLIDCLTISFKSKREGVFLLIRIRD